MSGIRGLPVPLGLDVLCLFPTTECTDVFHILGTFAIAPKRGSQKPIVCVKTKAVFSIFL
jgi:hypothetical protein